MDGQKAYKKMLDIINYLEKCKSKVQRDITSHWSEWPSSKNLQTINAGEGVEKREHSCTVRGHVDTATMEDGMLLLLLLSRFSRV